MTSKSVILSYFVTKQLLIEQSLYDLSINDKDIKFGARVKFDTLIYNNQYSQFILLSGTSICNPRWPTKINSI